MTDPPPSGPPALPAGFAVRLDRTVRQPAPGVLVGGSPGRLARLRPAAERLLAGGRLTVTDATSARLARYLLDAGLAQPDGAPPDAVPGRAEVTVVVPVRDRPEALDRLLTALAGQAAQTGVPAPPVVVVDDGSADGGRGTVAVAARHAAAVLRHPRSCGPAAARNTGLAAVTTPLVAFLDSDVLPEPGWLDALLAELADPLVAWAGPRITALPIPAPVDFVAGNDRSGGRTGDEIGVGRRAAGWVREQIARYEAVASSLDLGAEPARVLPRGRVAYLPSAAGLARVAALRGLAVPGFDPALQVGEDVDLLWRLHEAGWRVRYRPSSRVGHDHRTDPRGWLGRKAVYGSSAAALAGRHPGQVPPLAAPGWAAAVWALLLLQRRLPAAAALGVAVAGTARLAARVAPAADGTGTGARTGTGTGAGTGGIVIRRPRWTADPAAWRLAAGRLGPEALVGTGLQLGTALLRHWWPVALPAAVVSRRARRALLAALLADALADRRRARAAPEQRPVPAAWLLLRRLDDLAYGAGVWWGAWRDREPGPLLPVTTRAGAGAAVPAGGRDERSVRRDER